MATAPRRLRPLRVRRRRAGEHFVPGAAGRLRGVNLDAQLAPIARRRPHIGSITHSLDMSRVKRSLNLSYCGCRAQQRRGGPPQRLDVLRQDPRQRFLDQARADDQVERDALPRFDFRCQVPTPGAEEVDPGFDRENMRRHLRNGDVRAPAVVHQRFHRHPRPSAVLRATVEHISGDGVGTICVDVRLNQRTLADHALGREAPLIDLRPHAFDDNAPPHRQLSAVAHRRRREGHGRAGGRWTGAAGGRPAAGRCLPARGLATVGVWIVAFATGHIAN
jgi:hypothetical protein